MPCDAVARFGCHDRAACGPGDSSLATARPFVRYCAGHLSTLAKLLWLGLMSSKVHR